MVDTEKRLPKGSLKLDHVPLQIKKSVLRMRQQGKTLKHISYELNKQYAFKVNPVSISEWLKRRTDVGPSMIFGRQEYVTELEQQYVTTLNEFKRMTEMTWKVTQDIYDQSKKGTVKDKESVLKALGELRAQIELANQLLGALPKDSKQAEVIAKSVHMAVKKLDSEGLLKKYEDVVKDKQKKIDEEKEDRIEIEDPKKKGETLVTLKKVGLGFED